MLLLLFSSQCAIRTLCLAAGWALAAFLVYKVLTTEVENKVYDPFEVLGLRSVRSAHTLYMRSVVDCFGMQGVDVKAIKSHYKKLSRKLYVYLHFIVSHISLPRSHPDKVKLGINETMAMVEAKFVEITKAYKS